MAPPLRAVQRRAVGKDSAVSARRREALDQQLRSLIDDAHDCSCGRCHDRQRRMVRISVVHWCFLSANEQARWLDAHDEDDLGAALHRVLRIEAADGFDVAAAKQRIDAARREALSRRLV